MPWWGSEGEAIQTVILTLKQGASASDEVEEGRGGRRPIPNFNMTISRNNNIPSLLKVTYAVERETAGSPGRII